MGLFGKQKEHEPTKLEYRIVAENFVKNHRKNGDLIEAYKATEWEYQLDDTYEYNKLRDYMVEVMTDKELLILKNDCNSYLAKKELEKRGVSADSDLNLDDDDNDFGFTEDSDSDDELDLDLDDYTPEEDDDDWGFTEARKAKKEEYKSFGKKFVEHFRETGELIEKCLKLNKEGEITISDITYESFNLFADGITPNMTMDELLLLQDAFNEIGEELNFATAEINSRKKDKSKKENLNDDDFGFTEDSDNDDLDDDWGFTEDSEGDKKSDTSEMEDKLAKLKKLLDKGLISESDYNKRKEKFLDEMLNDDD